MIKAKTSDGKIILGLSEENIIRLKQGKPIAINLKEMGVGDIPLFIMYGKTEADIVVQLGIDMDIETQGNA